MSRLSFKSKQRAFTLIELLVVILIIAILVAVALPNFLGQQNKAHDSAVVQQLNTVRKDMKAAWIGGGADKSNAYPTTDTALQTVLADGEPQLAFDVASGVDNAARVLNLKDASSYDTNANPRQVRIARLDDDQAMACQKSKSTRVFCYLTNENGADVTTIASKGLFANDAAHANDPTTCYSNGATAAVAVDLLTKIDKNDPDAPQCVDSFDGVPTGDGDGTVDPGGDPGTPPTGTPDNSVYARVSDTIQQSCGSFPNGNSAPDASLPSYYERPSIYANDSYCIIKDAGDNFAVEGTHFADPDNARTINFPFGENRSNLAWSYYSTQSTYNSAAQMPQLGYLSRILNVGGPIGGGECFYPTIMSPLGMTGGLFGEETDFVSTGNILAPGASKADRKAAIESYGDSCSTADGSLPQEEQDLFHATTADVIPDNAGYEGALAAYTNNRAGFTQVGTRSGKAVYSMPSGLDEFVMLNRNGARFGELFTNAKYMGGYYSRERARFEAPINTDGDGVVSPQTFYIQPQSASGAGSGVGHTDFDTMTWKIQVCNGEEEGSLSNCQTLVDQDNPVTYQQSINMYNSYHPSTEYHISQAWNQTLAPRTFRLVVIMKKAGEADHVSIGHCTPGGQCDADNSGGGGAT